MTFEEFVSMGLAQPGSTTVDGVPWSFMYLGYPVSHETDDCYLITLPEETFHFVRRSYLRVDSKGAFSLIALGTSRSIY